MLRGASALPGVPFDVAGRLSVGNLIPGTGLFLRSKTDKGYEVAEALGPVGGLARNIGNLMQGNVLGAAPVAIQNFGKALDMHQTGHYRDTKGRNVIETDGMDAVMKGIGFQPREVAAAQRTFSMQQQQIDLARAVRSEVVSEWAQGIVEGDSKKSQAARQKLADWNETNPDSRIRVTPAAVHQKAKLMRMDKEQRIKLMVRWLRNKNGRDKRGTIQEGDCS